MDRHVFQNIPMEILRSVVAISEAGSMSKAAVKLDLSQPAVSSQIKRLQRIVGGEIYKKAASGTVPTELGRLVLQQARRIIEANDQILRLGGSGLPSVRRLGISPLFGAPLFQELAADDFPGLFILAGPSSEIRRGLLEEFIDIGCLFVQEADGDQIEKLIVEELEIGSCWVRSEAFTMRHGVPIPLITPSEHNWIVDPLVKTGVPYRVVLRSSDSAVRASAIKAGLGISAMAEPLLPVGTLCYLP